jgi:hypothetical protein
MPRHPPPPCQQCQEAQEYRCARCEWPSCDRHMALEFLTNSHGVRVMVFLHRPWCIERKPRISIVVGQDTA